jgi:hypothetical protein
MNQQSANSASSASSTPASGATTVAGPAPRCEHRLPSGRQCRSASQNAEARLCARHASAAKKAGAADITTLLGVARERFQSAEGINGSLAELFALLAENRVSARRAAVLAYIGSLLLRSLPAVDRELHGPAPKTPPRTVIFDLPGPERENQYRQSSGPGDVRINDVRINPERKNP